MKILTSRKDVIWSYAGTGLSMSANLVLLPFMVVLIEPNLLGLWYVYVSIGAISTLFDFGFNPTISRNITYAWSGATSLSNKGISDICVSSEPNYCLIKTLVTTCRYLYLIISLIALLLIGVIGTPYILAIGQSLDSTVVISSWLIYLFSIFYNLFMGYYATLLRGVGAVTQYNKVLVFARLIQLLIAFVMLFLNLNIMAMVLAYFAYGFLLRLFSKRALMTYQNFGSRLSEVTESVSRSQILITFKTMWTNAWRDGLVSLSNYLVGQGTVILASGFLSLSETGVYSISIQLVTAISYIACVRFVASMPSLQSHFRSGDLDGMQKIMIKSMSSFAVIFILLSVVLVLFGEPILSFIKPESSFDTLVFAYLAFYYFFFTRMQRYSSMISSTNEVPYLTSYLVSSAVSFILPILFFLFAPFGIWALLIGQSIPQLLYNCWKWPKYAFSILQISQANMIKRCFLYCRSILSNRL